MRYPRLPLLFFVLALAMGAAGLAAPPPKYHEIGRVSLEGAEGWDCLVVDSDARRLYVTRGTRVVVLDADSRKVVGEIKNTPGVHDVALDPTLHHGFTSNGQEDSVTVFDLKTLQEVERIKVGKRPDILQYDPASRRIFTFNAGSHDATAIDAATLKVVGTIALEGKPEFAVTDGKGALWVNLEDKSEIAMLDTRSLAVKARWPLAPGEEPSGLAFDAAHRRLFSVCGNKKMMVLDADSGKVVATAEIGSGPDGAAFDAKTGLAFSSNGQDGTLTVVKEDAPDRFHVAATVPTEPGARTMALDRKTHQVFLVTARLQPPPPGEAGTRRRSYVPGSFVVLVFGP
jgi:YVTN family beta-propeller protein